MNLEGFCHPSEFEGELGEDSLGIGEAGREEDELGLEESRLDPFCLPWDGRNFTRVMLLDP